MLFRRFVVRCDAVMSHLSKSKSPSKSALDFDFDFDFDCVWAEGGELVEPVANVRMS